MTATAAAEVTAAAAAAVALKFSNWFVPVFEGNLAHDIPRLPWLGVMQELSAL